MEWFIKAARAYFIFTLLLALSCCFWTFDEYRSSGKKTMLFYSGTSGFLTVILVVGLLLENYACTQRCDAFREQIRNNEWGSRAVHIACATVAITSVSAASVNLHAEDTHVGLQVLSVIVIIFQWGFYICCIPCNSAELAAYPLLHPAKALLIDKQYKFSRYMFHQSEYTPSTPRASTA